MSRRSIISPTSPCSRTRSITPPFETRGRAAKERFSRTDIGSINPSVLRSSGMRAMPLPFRRVRARRGPGDAGHSNLARYAAQDAEQSQQQFALALPVETAEADDFARFGGERNVAQTVPPAEVPELEQWRRSLCSRRRFRRKNVAVLTPDHHFDDLVVGLRSGHIGRDIGAVPEHGALVGEFRNLVHAVRNEQERQPLLAQALENDKHLGGGVI